MIIRQKSAPVDVEHAESFVTLTRRLQSARAALPRGKADGHPTRAAIDAATRLVRDRQSIAMRLDVEIDGPRVAVLVAPGQTPAERAARIELADDGRPTLILPGLPAHVFDGVGLAAFRKALGAATCPPSTGRVHSRKIEIDGIVFDSTIEGNRYVHLRQERDLGRIRDLRLQVPYRFEENGTLCFTYIADFVYVVVEGERLVVEDVKGMRMDVYKLKKKLIEARHGVTISEWPVPRKEVERRRRAEERRLQTERRAADAAARRDERLRIRNERAAAAAVKAAARAPGPDGASPRPASRSRGRAAGTPAASA